MSLYPELIKNPGENIRKMAFLNINDVDIFYLRVGVPQGRFLCLLHRSGRRRTDTYSGK